MNLNPNIITKPQRGQARPRCDCGRPATRKHHKEAICERCYQLELAGFTGGPACMTCGTPTVARRFGAPPGEVIDLQVVYGRLVACTDRGVFMRQGQKWQKVKPDVTIHHERPTI